MKKEKKKLNVRFLTFNDFVLGTQFVLLSLFSTFVGFFLSFYEMGGWDMVMAGSKSPNYVFPLL